MLIYPFRYLWWLLSSLFKSFGKPPDYITFLVETDLPALPDPPGPLWTRFISKPQPNMKELADRFELIAKDQRIKGVVLHLRPTEMAMSTRQDLRDLICKLRAANKRVIAWAPFYTTGSYYIALACDDILMMPVGEVHPLGFAATASFLADGLAKAGIKGDFVQISPYKSAADPITKSKMSPELREQITWLTESQHEQFVGAIMTSRGVDATQAKALIDGSPYQDEEAIEAKAVDKLVSEEQLPMHLGTATAPAKIATWEQAQGKIPIPAPTLGLGKYVAIMRIEGVIIDGRSDRPPVAPPIEIPLVGGVRAGDISVVQLARQIAADKRAAAAVLYVNSGGGSATSSEAMRQALEQLNARKPLVVCMGPVAASGGYWVATPARWITARPGTITGSIGVLSGKLVTGDMWTKLKVNRETIAFGKNVNMGNTDKTFTNDERDLVKKGIDSIYAAFLKRVSAARGMTVEEIHPMAAGRVWMGKQALDRKLVDDLGGLDAAIKKARELGGLAVTAPAREVKAPRKMIPPRAAGAAAYVLYLLEGMRIFSRMQTLAVMDYVPEGSI